MKMNYWERIAQTIAQFSQPDDVLECVLIFRSETDETCGLCGHTPIRWVHRLRNQRTNKHIDIGRECIFNYRTVREHLDVPAPIVFPEKYRKAAAWLNRQRPGTIQVHKISEAELEDFADFSEIEARYLDVDPLDMDVNDLAPEGMAVDEVDWDSFDWDQD